MRVANLLPDWVPWLGPVVVVARTLVSLAIIPGYPIWSVRRRVRPDMRWSVSVGV